MSEQQLAQEPETIRSDIIRIAQQAGKRVLEVYRQADFDVSYKQDESPLTKADLASQQHIVRELRALTPDIPILAEESADVPFTRRRHWRSFWLVDPLDGTKEFVKRNGEFTINIALIRDGRPLLGVVHAPVTQTTFAAVRGSGASKLTPNQGILPLSARAANDDGPLRVVVSRSHANRATQQLLDALAQDFPLETVAIGSSLKICLVAEGKAHLYPRLGPTMEWDTAAAQCILEEAGGCFTTLTGEAFNYNKEELTNPAFLASYDTPSRWLGYLGDEKS